MRLAAVSYTHLDVYKRQAVVRLVAEEAQHDLAELVAHRVVVGLMHRVQERVRRLRIEIVDDRVSRVLRPRSIGEMCIRDRP